MTISELQQTATNGQEFFVYSSKGLCYRCRWTNVKRGLYKILDCEGKVVKHEVECDIKGAPHMQAESIG